jgi:hypothetical protein
MSVFVPIISEKGRGAFDQVAVVQQHPERTTAWVAPTLIGTTEIWEHRYR